MHDREDVAEPSTLGEPMAIDGGIRIVTPNSMWLLTSDKYCRLPRAESPRPAEPSDDGALDDAVWHDHDGV